MAPGFSSRRGDQFRHGLSIRFAIVVHQPQARAGERQAGAYSGIASAPAVMSTAS
jgi:hypothetical protein